MNLYKDKKIIGIGNSLVDIIIKLENDSLLSSNNLPKGGMALIDPETSKLIDEQSAGFPKSLTLGGSVANTIYCLGQLGCKASFIGKVGLDPNGDMFVNDLKSVDVDTQIFKSQKSPTGHAMALISPDSERTFGTCLGASVELTSNDLTPDLFGNYDIVYIEGYLVQDHDLVETVAMMARKLGKIIALDLASYNVVEQNIDFLRKLVQEYVDILFANEEEAKAFTGKEPEEALDEISRMTDIAVVKIGKKGSLVQRKEEKCHCGVLAQKCIDTTGAGDLFAAGFLYALSKGISSLEICAKMGTIMAAQVIQTIGARITSTEAWETINKQRSAIGL